MKRTTYLRLIRDVERLTKDVERINDHIHKLLDEITSREARDRIKRLEREGKLP